MAEKIKKHKDIVLILGIGLILAVIGVLGMSGMVIMPGPVSAATDTVAVTATVAEWLAINITETTLALGELVDSAGNSHIRAASTTVDVGTNATDWSVTIHGVGSGDAGGLYSSSKTYLIPTGTPVAVNQNKYGAQGSDAQSGVGIHADYLLTVDNVGLISTSTAKATMATGTIRALGEAFTMTVKASAQTIAPAATDYGDTITLTLTPGT